MVKGGDITNDGKRYYWLKLKRDFFKRHDIRIIESMPNGKDYILFYLKLLCESVDHEGQLRFSETIPYNADMLSTITNTNVDVVKNAIKAFTELNMMELFDDGTIFMCEVEKMIGSAADNENANRQRRFREAHKQPALESGNVTENNGALQNVTDTVTENNESKSKRESKRESKSKSENKSKTEERRNGYDAIIDGEGVTDEKLKEEIGEFLKMRKLAKKPMTDRALTLMLRKLTRLAGNDTAMKIAILDQSIINNWQDVYELKTSGGKGGINGTHWKRSDERGERDERTREGYI